MTMKRLSIVIFSFLLGIQLFGQTITPNMGKRLTYWCNSQDSRMAIALNVLRHKYPNSDNLLRKVDNFENSAEDTKMVLLALYQNNGSECAYAAIHDYFTSEQIAIIEKIYIAEGGHVKLERTDEERERMSELALKRGITTDMAYRLSLYCYQNSNFQTFAIGILVKKGVSVMCGSYRIFDNFTKNLDYAEEVLLSLYDVYGEENAYYTLREFLTISQIDILDDLYETWSAQKKEEKKQQIANESQSGSGSVGVPMYVSGSSSGGGSGNGPSYDLGGRSAISLPQPSSDFTEEGIIVIDIWVDRYGHVLEAQIGKGTNIANSKMRQMAINTAKSSKFSSDKDAPESQKGRIVYRFHQ